MVAQTIVIVSSDDLAFYKLVGRLRIWRIGLLQVVDVLLHVLFELVVDLDQRFKRDGAFSFERVID